MGEFDHIVAAMNSSPIMVALKEMADANDYSRLDQNSAKRHHFVSQFLLRDFSDDRHAGEPAVFQMEAHARGAPRRVRVRAAASRRRLYAVTTDDGQMTNRNEGYLSLVETHSAPAIRELLSNPAGLTPGDRATIAFFVAFQTMRTPAEAERVTDLANAALRTAASEVFSDRDAFAKRHRQHFKSEASADQIEAFREELLSSVRDGSVRVDGKTGAAFGAALAHAAENVPALIAFDWTLLRAPGGGVITSDRGYAIHDPSPPFPWTAQGLLSSPASQTTVPLGNGSLLLLRPGDVNAGFHVREAELANRDVETFNLRTLGWADKYVFGKTEEELTRVRVASRRRRSAVVRPKPFCQVILFEPDPDDQSLAIENQSRGWPARISNGSGEPRDYLVIPVDRPDPNLLKRADDLAEHRARKRAGIGPGKPMSGRIVHRPLGPHEVTSPGDA